MTIITVPPAFKAGRIIWRMIRPSQVNRSVYTGRRQTVANPWFTRWEADVDFVDLEPTDAAQIRGFLAALDGTINTFRLPAVTEQQSGRTVVVNGDHLAGSPTISSSGWLPNQLALTAGQYVTINDQLCILTSDVIANGLGVAILPIRSRLRDATPNGTALNVGIPTVLVSLKTDTSEWTMQSGPTTSFSISVEEVF